MASICQIRVLSSGKYCCEPQHLTVRPYCVGEVSFTNLPLTTIEVELTPDNWAVADPESVEGDGCIKLYKPGTYRFGLDCEALNGTLAPEEGAIGLCYDTVCYTEDQYLDMLTLQELECLKETVQDLNLEIDLSDIITAIETLCDKVEQLPTVGTDLTSFGCIQDEEGNEVGVVLACKKTDATGNVTGIELWGLISGQAPIQNYTGEWKPCTSRTNELLEELIGKMCDILGDPELPCPECEDPAKEPVTYTNSDNETELVVSVGGDGDIKIDAGNGDGSEAEVVACIESCLAAGDEVVVTWTTVDGGSGSATLLPEALTNAFPAFYNQSTDAQGDSGKLLTLTCE